MAESRRGRITPMYLAHHYPEDYEHCVVIGGAHVCRRCLVLYPLAALVMVASLGWHPERAIDVAVVVLFPLPAVVELVLEQVGVLRYDRRRQVAVTIPLAVGLGRAFAIYLDDQASLLFWSVVVAYSVITVSAVAWRHWTKAHAITQPSETP